MFGNVGSTLSPLSSQYYTVWMWLAMLTNGQCARWFYPMEYASLPNPTTPVHKNLHSLSPLFLGRGNYKNFYKVNHNLLFGLLSKCISITFLCEHIYFSFLLTNRWPIFFTNSHGSHNNYNNKKNPQNLI